MADSRGTSLWLLTVQVTTRILSSGESLLQGLLLQRTTPGQELTKQSIATPCSWQLAASPAGPSDRGSALQPTGLNILPAGTNKNNLTANKNIGNMSFNKQKFTSVKLHKYYSKESKAQILIHFFLLFEMAYSSHSLNSWRNTFKGESLFYSRSCWITSGLIPPAV